MRWYTEEKKARILWDVNERERIVTRFLLFPHCIDGEFRWFGITKVTLMLMYNNEYSRYYWSWYKWTDEGSKIMKWNSVQKKRKDLMNNGHQKRTISKFLFFPLGIYGEYRWLCRATIRQGLYISKNKYRWGNLGWDEEKTNKEKNNI